MPRDELPSMTIRSTSKVAFTVLCFINVACWIGFVASEPSPERAELKQFWIPFRKAALQSDWRVLEGLTNFPLIVRGELHREPILRIRRSEFPTVFQRFLKEGVFSPNEQLEVIRSNSTIQTAASSDVTCRVGDMILKKPTRDGACMHCICNTVWTDALLLVRALKGASWLRAADILPPPAQWVVCFSGDQS